MFASVEEQNQKADLVDHANRDGLRVVTVPENIRNELQNEQDIKENEIRNLGVYRREFNEANQYEWVTEDDITPAERRVWDKRHE